MRTCILLMKTPCTEGESWRVAEAVRAKGDSLYLLGDAVMICRRGYRGHPSTIVSTAADRGSKVMASARDLRARGIGLNELTEAVEVIEDLEGLFVDEAMERADRVIAW
jgi:sulfur relay protein TusB/DsrH